MAAIVELFTLTSKNPEPQFNGTGWGVSNGLKGQKKRWHYSIWKDKGNAQRYADSINVDFDRFGAVNIGYPEPVCFSREEM